MKKIITNAQLVAECRDTLRQIAQFGRGGVWSEHLRRLIEKAKETAHQFNPAFDVEIRTPAKKGELIADLIDRRDELTIGLDGQLYHLATEITSQLAVMGQRKQINADEAEALGCLGDELDQVLIEGRVTEATKKPSGHPRPTEAEIQADQKLNNDFKASGLTYVDFARERGISPNDVRVAVDRARKRQPTEKQQADAS